MSDTTQEPAEATSRERVTPMLVRALIASAALHCLPLLGMLQVAWPDADGFQADWEGTFGDLSGVGHGASGRWAKLSDAPPPPKESEEETSPEEAPEDEPEVKPPEAKPPEEVAEEPEKKKPPRKKPEPKKLAVEDATTPEPPEPKKTPDAEPPAEKEPDEEVAQTPEDEPPPPKVAAREPGDLPGLRRSGPSNLPNFKDYAPGNARMTALFRLDRIRGSGLDASITDALGAVPDFHILMNSTGVVPTRDLTSVFAASADPRYIQETFWAFRHTMGKEKFKDALSRRFTEEIPWTTYEEMPQRALVPEGISYRDPRSVVLVDDELALVTQPRWLPALTRDLAEDSSLRDPAGADGPSTMLDGVARIEQAADASDAFAMLSFQGQRFMIPGYGTLPRFETVRVALSDVTSPKLVIDLQFRSPATAAKFARDCPEMKADVNTMAVRMMGLSSYITRLECAAVGEYVTVDGAYTQAEVIRILELVHTLMPAPLAIGALPPAPQKTPPPEPTAPAPGDPEAPPLVPPVGGSNSTPPSTTSGATNGATSDARVEDAPEPEDEEKEKQEAAEVDAGPPGEKTPADPPDAAPSEDEAK